MPTTSPDRSYRVPELGDAPNGPVAYLNLASDVEDDIGALEATVTANAAPPVCVVRHDGTADSVGTSSWTALSADTDVIDPDGLHDTVTNNSRITITQSGLYRVHAIVEFAGNATGQRLLAVAKNGVATSAHDNVDYRPAVSASYSTYSQATLDAYAMAASDYVEVRAWQDSGGSLNVRLRRFSATYIRATP